MKKPVVMLLLALTAFTVLAQVQDDPVTESGNLLADEDTVREEVDAFAKTNMLVWADYQPAAQVQWVGPVLTSNVLRRIMVLPTGAGTTVFHVLTKFKTNAWDNISATNVTSLVAGSTYLETNLTVAVDAGYYVGVFPTNVSVSSCTNLHVTFELEQQ